MSWKLKSAVFLVATGVIAATWWTISQQLPPAREMEDDFLGSGACKDCHEPFYAKWAASWHGLAMRPYTANFARENLTPQEAPVEFRGRSYQADVTAEKGVVRESGPKGKKEYPILHVLGGKNVFYFLTPLRGGRLQVLPLAYDSRKKEWYNTTTSMVRHFRENPDEPVDWTERPLTFNTSCFSCHVSQLSKNYSFETDTYQTVWGEPGINCESCHASGKKHVEVARAAHGKVPDPLEIIVTRNFTHAQTNSMCAPCHAKMYPLTQSFTPGDRFFDHFNLTTIEDRDLYPDGRELGENYTYGPFLISACSASGQLDCMHCHTSSGRNKHTGENADRACLPCHATIVKNAAAHSFHPVESDGSRCVSCHMPMTVFARMRRHDHSMQAPTPAATLEFKSPNACNLCHEDKDAAWANTWVRKWYPEDYQEPILHRARLIAMARKGDWSKLDAMIAYVTSKERNIIYASGLLRLLQQCRSPRKWPAFFKAIKDPSPLVRASAARGLADGPDPQAFQALVDATADDCRLVRIESATAFGLRPVDRLPVRLRERVQSAFEEYKTQLLSRPDDPFSYYNLANHYQDRGNYREAIRYYESALKLDPRIVPVLVNLALAHSRIGDTAGAELALRRALRVEPASAQANFNLGLLLAEQGHDSEAETCFRVAWKTDPKSAQTAYNLGTLLAGKALSAGRDPAEGIALCRKAAELEPENARYRYSLAFFLYRARRLDEAVQTLRRLLDDHPDSGEAAALLGAIYEEGGNTADALQVYRSVLATNSLSPPLASDIAARIEALEKR